MSSPNPFDFVSNYRVDAWQRSILALDVLRERGDIYLEHNAKNAPNVLKFEAEFVADGRTLPCPVNYGLARILTQDDGSTDPTISEAERFLDFETKWDSPVLLNASEMQWIADNLFVGNKLAAGEILASSGRRVDLRNIKSPVIVFRSWGDNITPPQQALGWITDLYDHERDIVANGQTIVYTTHQTIGHLGIFVSGKVASKEHAEFANCMDMIDLLPPGLYEAVITEVDERTASPGLIEGKYLFRLETRTLDNIRAFGRNDEADERRFATAARLSEMNLGLYRSFMQPFVRAMVTDKSAEAMRDMHPSRLRFAAFAGRNPLMQPVKSMAQSVRDARRPVSPDIPLLAMEQVASTWISTSLDSYRIAHDTMTEMFFVNLYGSPVLQAMMDLGADTASAREQREAALDVVQRIVNSRGELTPDEERRLRCVESLFGGLSLVTPTQESARA